jgi:hypothetical protein
MHMSDAQKPSDAEEEIAAVTVCYDHYMFPTHATQDGG